MRRLLLACYERLIAKGLMGGCNDGCNEGCSRRYAGYYLPTISYTVFQWRPGRRLIPHRDSAFGAYFLGPSV
jgi:hypothetical protein